MLKLSHSSLQLFQTCPKKYYYQRIEKWASRISALPLARGKAIHEALDHFYKTKSTEEATEKAIASITQEALLPQEKEAITPIVKDTLALYFQDQEIYDFQVIDSEIDKSKQLTEDVVYVGKIDTIVNFRGMEFLRETKTTTQIASQWEQKYSLDNQTLGYLWLLDGKVPGIILDLIRIPDGKKTKYPEFVRSSYFPHPHLLAEWEEERTGLAKVIQAATRGEIPFAKNTASCFDYNRACGFFPFCSKSLSESELPNLFTKRTDI